MSPVTEVVLLTLAADADFSVLAELASLLTQQAGCLAVRSSRVHDEPDNHVKVYYFVDWDSVDSHVAFTRNEDVYRPFRDLIAAVAVGFTPPYHVALEPYPPAVFDGAAMVGTAWFPLGDDSASSGKTGEEVFKAMEGFGAALREDAAGFDGKVVMGWALEDGVLFQGEMSRVFFFAAGCGSVGDCLKFKGSEDWKGALAGVYGIEGLRGLEVCVVSAEDFSD